VDTRRRWIYDAADLPMRATDSHYVLMATDGYDRGVTATDGYDRGVTAAMMGARGGAAHREGRGRADGDARRPRGRVRGAAGDAQPVGITTTLRTAAVFAIVAMMVLMTAVALSGCLT
jgi:hypothetical protein